MKKTNEPTLDDVVRLAGSMFGLLGNVWRDVRGGERLARGLDLVTREEFDAAFAMLKKIRTTQNDIEKRLERLEGGGSAANSGKEKPNKRKRS